MVEKIELCAIVCNCLKIIKQTCWTASSDEAVTTGKGYKMSHKYVYLFSEGNGHMRELLGGKGANLAEMTNLGMPVPQGFTITTEACTQYYKDDRADQRRDRGARSCEYVGKAGRDDRQEVRRPVQPAAGLRPLRRPRFHARHDGHHPEPGPQRRGRRRPSPRRPTIPALPTTPTAASSRCTPTSSWRSARSTLSSSSTR